MGPGGNPPSGGGGGSTLPSGITDDTVAVLSGISSLPQSTFDANLATAIAINNGASDERVTQAQTDAGMGTSTVASAVLGSTLAEILSSGSTTFTSALSQATALTSSDSSYAKSYFGALNAYGTAYGTGSSNPRPFVVSDEIIQYGSGGGSSYPSGHSTYGFTTTLLLAIAVPEAYQELLYRGSEYGTSRIVLGVHYPLDVIAARILAMKDVVALLANASDYTDISLGSTTIAADYASLLSTGISEVRAAMAESCGTSVAECVSANLSSDYMTSAEQQAAYIYSLTYGLTNGGSTTDDPVVPENAELLLITRFPYLTAAQRRDVLATTELPSGGALDDGTGWARLDLYTAANGYGAFTSDVTVTMDADLGGFNAADTWSNDISGVGGLTKAGTGTLTLSGDNSYAGDTIVAGGTLQITGAIASAATVQDGGTLVNAGTVASVDNEDGGTFANLEGASAGAVTNAGTAANAGTIASLLNTDGAFDNSGTITGDVTVTGGDVYNAGAIGGDVSISDGTFQAAGDTTISGTYTNASSASLVVYEGTTFTAGVINNLADSYILVESGATLRGTGASINNSGLLESTGTLEDATDINNLAGAYLYAAGTLSAPLVTNDGTFVVTGDLAATVAQLTNSGTLVVTADGAALSTTGSVANSGTIALASGTASYTRLSIAGDYSGSGSAVVTMDVDLSANGSGVRSDTLAIGGAASGSTKLVFANVGGSGYFASPITVVTDDGTGSAGAFTAVGLTSNSLIDYDLTRSGSSWRISSTLNPAAAGATAASWAAALTAITTGFAEPIHSDIIGPADPIADQTALRLWMRGKGGQLNLDATATATGRSADLHNETFFAGVQGGLDLGRYNIAGSGLAAHLGLTGGWLDISAKDSRAVGAAQNDLDVPFAGLYAALTGNGFFAEVQAWYLWYQSSLTNSVTALDEYGNDANGYGIFAYVGQSFDMGGMTGGDWFLEPSAGLAYASADPESIALSVGTVRTDSVESLMGSLRLKAGTVIDIQDYRFKPALRGAVWSEFADDTSGAFTGSGATHLAIATSRVGTFGEVGVELDIEAKASPLSGQFRANYINGDGIDGASVSGGLRYQF